MHSSIITGTVLKPRLFIAFWSKPHYKVVTTYSS